MHLYPALQSNNSCVNLHFGFLFLILPLAIKKKYMSILFWFVSLRQNSESLANMTNVLEIGLLLIVLGMPRFHVKSKREIYRTTSQLGNEAATNMQHGPAQWLRQALQKVFLASVAPILFVEAKSLGLILHT